MAIYFVQAGDGGPIKVGFANEPRKRLSKIQADNHEPCRLLGVMAGGKDVEAEIHKRIDLYRVRGEWFRPDAEVLRVVALADRDDGPTQPATSLAEHLSRRGVTSTGLAARLGVAHTTVLRWVTRRVPAERVHDVSAATGLAPRDLRPDLFAKDGA